MKNCPFCGSHIVGPCSNTRSDGVDITMIFCDTCGATGPVVIYKSSHDDEKAIQAWNTRHNAHALGRAAKPGVPVRNKVTNDKSYLLELFSIPR